MASLNFNLDSAKGNSEVVQLVELGNGVVKITMKDEENHNTFSSEIIDGLYKCFGAVAQNKSYKVVILTGYGNYFCSGGTKEELIKIYKGELQFNELDFFRILLDCEIPVIAAMQGHGIGGGFVFGLYADLVVLSQESIYTTNFMKYGFTPGLGSTFIVPTKLGSVLGQEMMYTAQNYRGKELFKKGIPFPVVPRKEVLNHALMLGYKIAEKPRLSLVTLKEHLTSEIKKRLPEVLEKELKMHDITFHQLEVANRIETIYGDTNISSQPHNLSQELVNESADVQNQVPLLSSQKNRQEIIENSITLKQVQLKISSYGLLNNLTLAPLQRRVLGCAEVEVQIKAVAVNFRDVINALGMLKEYNEQKFGITSVENLIFGFEGVGTIVAVGEEVTQWQVGDEVMVIGIHDAFSSFIVCSPNNLVAKPSNLSMVSAATIPIPFFTAAHGLYNLAKIQPGERVLIHAAAGGTGQASVQLAQLMGAEVFATASPGKMAFLQRQGIKHIMNSRTTEFADQVMELTQGCGVDVIFNSLTHGEYIQKNIDILALGGRYVEIGKLNIWSHEQVAQKRADVKYFPFDLGDEFAKDSQLFSRIWGKLAQHFERDYLKPLHYKEFPLEDVVESFRYIQHSKHIGRVVVTMPESSYWGEESNGDRLSNQNKLINQEDVLHQLQSGAVSLEEAEKLLLGFTEEVEETLEKKPIENGHNKLINQEDVLHQLQSGAVSLEEAEKLLLGFTEEVEETLEKKPIENGHNKLINQEDVLHQLQSGAVSLEEAEKLLLGFTEEVEETLEKKPIENGHNKLITKDDSESILSLQSAGAISLENIENGHNKLITKDDSESILSLQSAGAISLENAEKLLLEKTVESETKINTVISKLVKNTDIAIIGISCRYPGAKNWQEFWKNLKNGIDSVTEVPPGRWQEKEWYHPDPEHVGTSYSKCAGFLDEIDKFDPLFFQISPVEAQFIEPQQRIFLEEAYHAIEDAGYATDSLKGKQCGVFVGAGTNGDYNKLLSIAGLDTHRLALTGNLLSMIPARIAYFLDLRGPVVAIDTACSSSLVAVHQACESIQRGESELAIAGGIAIMATADFQVLSSQFQMLSAAGRCKTFDASASGTVWSEGCGVVLLKSYEQAIRDNDHIYAVIKGTGVNYDGNTNGISAPSGQSQTRLEEGVYQKFGINPETISYVEAHGTATPLGDPIEVEGLTAAFSKWTTKKQFCAIGSVKTNIGHAATSAGISGLIKTILCLKNQKLVPSLHFNQPNPHIDFENSPFYVNTEFKDWQVTDRNPRRATVSSFGFSGTNAHLVIEEAPLQVNSQNLRFPGDEFSQRSHHLLTLSAKCEKGLQELVQDYQEFLETNSTAALSDVCFSANTGRSHFDYRLALVAESTENLLQQLKAFATGEETTKLLRGQATSKERPKIAFLFTGQGSQYVDMGRELYSTQPVFRKTLEECDRILRLYLDKPLLNILYPASGDTSVIDETAYTQPALFAIEYALVQLWKSWGIQPDVVMGHSAGEYVAACVAGVFSLEDALKLIAHRGKLMQALPANGKMVSVMADEATVTAAISSCRWEVAIAAYNGPESIVISDQQDKVDVVKALLEDKGIKTKELNVFHAFHSPLMEPMLAEYETIATQVSYKTPQIPLISNVTGKRVDESIASAKYWVRHVKEPVKFAQSMETLNAQGNFIFLEIGPKPILLGMGRQCLPSDVGVWLPSLRQRVKDWQQILNSLGQLYVQGIEVDWSEFDRDYARCKVTLPTYPFQRQRYWVETAKDGVGQQKVQSLKQENTSSPIYHLLCKGETELVSSELEKLGVLSQDEIKLLPKLLKLLVEQHQQQFKIESNAHQNESAKTDEKIASPPASEPSNKGDEILAADSETRQQLLRTYIGQILAKVVGISPAALNWQKRLSELGFDSLMAADLRKTIDSNLKVAVPVEYLAELNIEQFLTQILYLIEQKFPKEHLQKANSTIDEQKSSINPVKKVVDEAQKWFKVSPRNSQPQFRLFCFPHAGASSYIFNSWPEKFASKIEVCPIQLPGRGNRVKEPAFTKIKPLVQTFAPLLKPYLDVPFAFFGHSMGALLSFELARELRRQNYPNPDYLFVGGYRAPHIPDLNLPIYKLPEPKFIQAISGYGGIPENMLQDPFFLQTFLPTFRADFELLDTYFHTKEEPLESPIYIFGGLEDHTVGIKELSGWEEQTKANFKLKMFNGDHFFLRGVEDEIINIIEETIFCTIN
uniref:CylH n=1 Tax=Cylindrospermum licheniforme UTEX B 2014 TaxID=379530 RepID=K7S6E9_9NOST|nr:polyketide synthase [Cylindrospermum licheniforme UTEX B 2014]ARU81122.1 CylH [Cylindrospermum licheniforme UTEX B 2014]